LQNFIIASPKKGFGTAEVGITLALMAILMIGFLVLGSNLRWGVPPTSQPLEAQPPETPEGITLRMPN
jgi:hypothetical protein